MNELINWLIYFNKERKIGMIDKLINMKKLFEYFDIQFQQRCDE